jgi:UDP-glucose 4-epimerase
MIYLVTGSSGFIGKNLKKNLQSIGHEVICFDIQDNSGDIRNYAEILKASEGVDGIYHLAATASVQDCIKNPDVTFENNVIGTQNIFRVAKKNNLPVVYASSAAVYGDNECLPLDEYTKPIPLSPYAEHKLKNEIDALESGLKTFGLRLFNVYGPSQDPSSSYAGVISIFLDLIRSDQDLVVYGDGKQSRDFVYIEDVTNAFIVAMKNVSTNSPVANICTGKSTTLLNLIDQLSILLKKEPVVIFRKMMDKDIRHSLGNPKKFEELTGFSTITSFEEGIRKLVQ